MPSIEKQPMPNQLGVRSKGMMHHRGEKTSFLALLLVVMIAFFGCLRELSFEKGTVAKGSLQAAVTGDCLPKKAEGIFKEGAALTSANTVEVLVVVAAPGAYFITTNAVNGYSFNGAGRFTATGPAVVVLQSKGTPLLKGTDSFTVRFDSSVCGFPVTVVSALTPPADYTLVSGGTPSNCASAVVNGNYAVNTLLDASHFAAVKVNVTTKGTDSLIATGRGLSFSSSGVFTTTGVQTVLLKASGIPAAQGVTIVTFTPPFASCSFAVDVNGPAVFAINCTAGGILYEGPVTSISETFAGLNMYTFRLNGLSQIPAPGYSFSLVLIKQYSSGANPDVLGTYVSSGSLSQGQAALQLNTGTGGFLADSLSGNLIVVRTLRNEGTFSGTVIDSSSASLPLTNGYFRY